MVGTDRRAVHPVARCAVAPYHRIVFRNLAKPNRDRRTTCPAGRCLRHEFLAGCDLTPAYRRAALSAEIIKDFAVGQDQ